MNKKEISICPVIPICTVALDKQIIAEGHPLCDVSQLICENQNEL